MNRSNSTGVPKRSPEELGIPIGWFSGVLFVVLLVMWATSALSSNASMQSEPAVTENSGDSIASIEKVIETSPLTPE